LVPDLKPYIINIYPMIRPIKVEAVRLIDYAENRSYKTHCHGTVPLPLKAIAYKNKWTTAIRKLRS